MWSIVCYPSYMAALSVPEGEQKIQKLDSSDSSARPAQCGGQVDRKGERRILFEGDCRGGSV